MARVLAVNNYPTGERFERLVKALNANGSNPDTVTWDMASASKFDSYDGVVLSGSPDMLSEPRVQRKYAKEMDAIRDSRVPILGVCFGHQMIASAFGAEVVKDSKHVLAMVDTTVIDSDSLFDGLPRSMMLLESRWEVVKSVPDGWLHLAKSATTRVAGMKHPTRPLYGVQSHPERYTAENPAGSDVIANFLRLL